MKTTITKSLRWTLLFALAFLLSVFSTNASAGGGMAPLPSNWLFGTTLFEGGGPMPTPPYPPIQVSFGAAFFEGGGPAPLPPYPPFRVALGKGQG